MQPAPLRLQQAIWTAFKAARPVKRSIGTQIFTPAPASIHTYTTRKCTVRTPEPSNIPLQHLSRVRFYSDQKNSELEKKVDDARQRINDTIESRAENTVNLSDANKDVLKTKEDETIIHTIPESSSIVYSEKTPGEAAEQAAATKSASPSSQRTSTASKTQAEGSGTAQHDSSSSSHSSPLPSQLLARYSSVRSGLTSFMDNFQTHIFTASRRLNDLTGYTSIESLKRSIEDQEADVRRVRDHVYNSRKAYQDAIATRSATQREVNDLLHRKHAWSATDLERFTNIYRSDHANEQAELKAHESLTRAETEYEEASTRLSKSILARYHEEQVWSDKIRQMSTWGTWGLMGLNVLLFVVFQILIEPWRRRRLVRGFEEKVQEALREQTAEHELRTLFHIKAAQQDQGQEVTATAADASTQTLSAASADFNASDTLISTTDTVGRETSNPPSPHPEPSNPTISEMIERTQIEQAAESLTAAEIQSSSSSSSDLNSSQSEDPLTGTPYRDIPFRLGTRARTYVSHAREYTDALFDENATLSLTRRELSAKVLEGAFYGAVGVLTVFWAVGVGAAR